MFIEIMDKKTNLPLFFLENIYKYIIIKIKYLMNFKIWF